MHSHTPKVLFGWLHMYEVSVSHSLALIIADRLDGRIDRWMDVVSTKVLAKSIQIEHEQSWLYRPLALGSVRYRRQCNVHTSRSVRPLVKRYVPIYG